MTQNEFSKSLKRTLVVLRYTFLCSWLGLPDNSIDLFESKERIRITISLNVLTRR